LIRNEITYDLAMKRHLRPCCPPSWKGRGQYPVLRRPWPSETLFC